MKRIQIFLAGAFIATGSLFAQSSDAEWQAGLARMKSLVQTDPGQASDEAEQLLKGKNKKNPELVIAVARVFLDAGNLAESEEYLALAKKADNKSAAVSLLEGDIALAKKETGVACQMYEQAIYFNPKNEQAYLKLADIYKGANPQQAIEKLEQLKSVDPSNILADKKLAEVYYMNNDFDKATDAYARFIDTPEATEDDMVRYAFALFLNHKFERSLEIVNMGLKRNAHHAAFNRLAMYNYTDLKRFDEAEKAADVFFTEADKVDYSYLDYMYYGHLLSALKKYDEAVVQYQKAIELDNTKTELWREISDAYEQKNDYTNAILAYQKYYQSLPANEQTPDLQFQVGKLYYGKGTQSDTLTVSFDERKAALAAADSVFTIIAAAAPDSYLGNFWRARTNSALDPETTQGLAKPYYEEVVTFLTDKNDPRYNSALIECYSYLGYYYLVANKLPESKEYWNKILAIDPANATAKRALDGIK
ncbi:tetratricopeptide repeat protein [Oscillospiraceae bacterium N12]|jgi:tetratricopeptide (TPR) repeat protein|uniref:Tetratricopeptide repeat protein n=1 Tax=Jilunia laotingensis TaxID=2763675 RepID=A0A926IPZ1_9BACT|nr:tetratricopeptide repeat protein [Jilunia laotingensis]MBC8593266.1 tetratricopeptide repeat protein [Jilunia laotingensis]